MKYRKFIPFLIFVFLGMGIFYLTKMKGKVKVPQSVESSSRITGSPQHPKSENKTWDHIGYIRISPNGKTLAFTARKENLESSASSYDYSLYLLSLDTKKLLKLVDKVGAYFSWEPSGKGIFYEKEKENKDKIPSIYFIEISHNKSKLIAASAVRACVSPDGESLVYLPRGSISQSGRQMEEKNGIVYQKKDGSGRKLFLRASVVLDFSFSSDGRYIGAFTLPLTPEPPFYTVIDTKKGVEKRVGYPVSSPLIISLSIAPPVFLGSNICFFPEVEEDESSGDYLLRLTEYDLSTARKSVVYEKRTKEVLSVLDMRPSPQRDKCLIVILDQKNNKSSTVWLYNSRDRMMEERIMSIDYGRGKIDWDRDGKRLIFVRQGHIYILTLGGKEERLL